MDVRKKTNHHKIYKTIRKVTDSALTQMNNELNNIDWNIILDNTDVNTAYSKFITEFECVYDKHCPEKKIRIDNKKPKKPWLTNNLIKCCRKKYQLYKKFIKNRTIKNEQQFKNYRNKLKIILQMAEKQYYNDLLQKHVGDIKSTWTILNKIVKKGNNASKFPNYFIDDNNKKITNVKDIANGFNAFFANIGPKLADKINPPDGNQTIYDYLTQPTENTIFLQPVTEEEIKITLKTFKNKVSNDCDNINMSMVKQLSESLVKPLTHICNLSFISGIFPDKMKIAKIIPLFKSGNKNQFTNYRPVSLLSQFSKLLERLYYNRLNNFIEKNNIISDSQYGFRNKRSTSQALMDLIEQITDNIDNKKATIGIFIDLKKAFDTVNHDLLLKKLRFYGVRGIAHNWIESYLTNRKQYVSLNDTSSDMCQVACGVPQGSILGPLLFILYINDLTNASTFLKYVLFADDTNLFASGTDINALCVKINTELDRLKNWFSVNKLSLNLSKTNYMIFSNSKHTNISLSMNATEIERVTVTKFLGVLVDEKLNWKQHISSLRGKLSKCSAIIYKASSILQSTTLITLYNTLFLPYIAYCAEIWGNACLSNLNSIILAQKRVIRIVAKAHKFDHTNILFSKYCILKFVDLVRLKIALVVHKAKFKSLPPNLQRKFRFNTEDLKPNLRNASHFKVSYSRTSLKQRCISVNGVNMYNALPSCVKSAKSLYMFKRRYKSIVIESYVNQ